MPFFLFAKGLPIAVQARLSGISRSRFYYKRRQPKKDEDFWEHEVRPVHESHPYYGYKRIANELRVSHKRVYRCMRLHGIRAKSSRRKHSKNQYSKGKSSLPNLMKVVSIERPDQVWAGDFTHFTWKGRTYYLATVMDICTRQIVGWHVSPSHSVELVLEALKMALGKRSKAPMIFHSDHGSEYISEEYVSKLKAYGITPSNSAKGKPWQNGFVESWNYRFKEELGDPNRFRAFELLFQELCSKVTEYNTDRIHSVLKMSPDAFHLKKSTELEAFPKVQEAA
jgi:transposase InsO family protein